MIQEKMPFRLERSNTMIQSGEDVMSNAPNIHSRSKENIKNPNSKFNTLPNCQSGPEAGNSTCESTTNDKCKSSFHGNQPTF